MTEPHPSPILTRQGRTLTRFQRLLPLGLPLGAFSLVTLLFLPTVARPARRKFLKDVGLAAAGTGIGAGSSVGLYYVSWSPPDLLPFR